MAKSRGLGKGLDALFGDGAEGGVSSLRVIDIEPNPDQPRRAFGDQSLIELSESIRQNGIITPITVRKAGDRYQIVAGERRWRASRMAGLSEIPALVIETTEEAGFALALIENLQREDLNPIEEAEGYRRLITDFGMTQEQAAERVGKSRPAVANALRLLALPEKVKQAARDGEISAGHARAIAAVENEAEQLKILDQIMIGDLSVRETEKLVKMSQATRKQAHKSDDIYVKDLERALSTNLGRKVSISHGKSKGKLTVEYYGNDDLDALCRLLSRGKQALTAQDE